MGSFLLLRLKGVLHMGTGADIFIDAFTRIHKVVHSVVKGLSAEQLGHRLDGNANSIAWLVWHLTRIQDDHVAEVAEIEQVWTSRGWLERLGLPFDPADTGFGHGSDDVAAVRVESGDLLLGYHDATHEQTREFLTSLSEADFDRIVDESWDPPVTLGVRLVSVVSDDLQHAGQAAFVRGLLPAG
jgi:Protein of unknown function (DUF664)